MAPLVVDVRVIVAPGTTRPLGSVTVPVMRPVSVCANTVAGRVVARLASKNVRRSNTCLKGMTLLLGSYLNFSMTLIRDLGGG
jgi:hypothetical protein